MSVTVDTERLMLKPMSLNDAEFVKKLVNSKAYRENIGERNVQTIEDAELYIQEKMIDHYSKHGYGNYVMIKKSDGTKIGCISLYNRDDVEGVDIGFAMLPEFMNKGFAYEGAVAIKSYAKDQLGLLAITAFTTQENIASRNLIDKLGLKFEKKILFGADKEELLFYQLKF